MKNQVYFQDPESGSVVRIPAAEIPAGAIAKKLQGFDDSVWVLPAATHGSLLDDEDCADDYEQSLGEIQTTFAEHRPLSVEQWAAWLRGQADPDFLIGMWLRAAETYRQFAPQLSTAQQRREWYLLLDRAVDRSPAVDSASFQPQHLDATTAQTVINRLFGREEA